MGPGVSVNLVRKSIRPRRRYRRGSILGRPVRGSNEARFTGRRTWFATGPRMSSEYLHDEESMTLGTAVSDNTYLACSDQTDVFRSDIRENRIRNGENLFLRKTNVLVSRKDLVDFVEKTYRDLQVVQTNDEQGIVFDFASNRWLEYFCSSNSTRIYVYGDLEWVEEQINYFHAHYAQVSCQIDWVYSNEGNSITIPLISERLPVKEMYPFLGEESLEDYYDRYMASSASILVLIGPPGTAKTTFIRGLLAHTQSSALVTYDAAILSKDFFFASFIDNEANVMVLEDSDNFLKSRSDGNSIMHLFLNLGDGLVTTKGKKMVFSTNLPSIRDIDPALIRPGRCFDIITFDNLTQDQAEKMAEKFDITLKETRNHWSVAEVFGASKDEQKHQPEQRRVGFF